MKRTLQVVLVCLVLGGVSHGDDGSVDAKNELEQLIEMQKVLMERIEKLEDQIHGMKAEQAGMQASQAEMRTQQEEIAEQAAEAGKIPGWVERFQLTGDFRYRYESIDQEGERDRDLNQIRLRVGWKYRASERLDFQFQFATGNTDDPVSTNQTLDNAFSNKNVWLDLAYMDYHPDFVPGGHLVVGKMENPFYKPHKTELIWDNDLRPEGLAVTYRRKLDRVEPFGALGVFWADERSDASDPYYIGVQAGLTYTSNSGDTQVTGGLSGFFFDNMKGEELLFDDTDPYGNHAIVRGLYSGDYTLLYRDEFTLLEAFAETQFTLRKIPFTIFGDYVRNTEADSGYDTGWLAGFSVGQTGEPRSWQFLYNYRHLEADAVVGVWTSSAFIGGGTNGRGHKLQLSYQASKLVKLAGTYYIAETPLQRPEDVNRLLLEVNLKF